MLGLAAAQGEARVIRRVIAGSDAAAPVPANAGFGQRAGVSGPG